MRGQHRHEHALPGKGPQQGDHGQYCCAQQPDLGREEHQLPLEQGTCSTAAFSEPLQLAAVCMFLFAMQRWPMAIAHNGRASELT